MCNKPNAEMGLAINMLREAVQCVPMGNSDSEMMAGLLAVAGWVYMTAHRIQFRAGWDSYHSAGWDSYHSPTTPSLLRPPHAMLKPLPEGSVEELIQRASLCYLQVR